MQPTGTQISAAERAERQARIDRDNLERLLNCYEESIRWHEAAIKRHNAEIARLNKEHAAACQRRRH